MTKYFIYALLLAGHWLLTAATIVKEMTHTYIRYTQGYTRCTYLPGGSMLGHYVIELSSAWDKGKFLYYPDEFTSEEARRSFNELSLNYERQQYKLQVASPDAQVSARATELLDALEQEHRKRTINARMDRALGYKPRPELPPFGN